MRISLIVAAAENHVIGRDGDLPWHLPADLRYFKDTTMGHPVIMGRRTWESFEGGLPGRRCIVVSRNPDLRLDDAVTVTSLDDAIAEAGDAAEVFIAGGGEIYRLSMERADRILLTRIHDEFEGDASFPALDPAAWHLESAERREADERNASACTFEVWVRATAR